MPADIQPVTLNLRLVGSIPTRLTIDSKGLSDIDHRIHGDYNLLVVGSTFTRLTIDSTALAPFTTSPVTRLVPG